MTRNLTLIVLALCATGAAAEVYSWKDAEGKTHFSDTPPAGKEPSLKTITLPPAGTAAPTPSTAPRPKTAPASPPASAVSNEESAARKKQANCEKAKADFQAFENKPRRTAIGKGGKFFALDGEERATEEANLQKVIDEHCR